MAIQELWASSHITGDCATPDNANGSTDGTFTTNTGNTNWTSRWAMENPSASITGTQTIKVICRKESAGGNDPSVLSVDLYENGSLVTSAIIGTTTITSATSQEISGTFDASVITNPDNVEILVDTQGAGGPPASRRSVQIDSINWEANLDAVVTTLEDSADVADSMTVYKQFTIMLQDAVDTEDAETTQGTGPSFIGVYPVIEGYATSVQDTLTTSRDISLPTGIVADELLIAFIQLRSIDIGEYFIPTGWTEIAAMARGTAFTAVVMARIADETEGSSVTMSCLETGRSAHIAVRISGHNVTDVSTDIPSSIDADNTGSIIGPLLNAPWGSDDTLWIAFCGVDGGLLDLTDITQPTGYDELDIASGGSADTNYATMTLATLESDQSGEGTTTWAVTDWSLWSAGLVAIEPGPYPVTGPVERTLVEGIDVGDIAQIGTIAFRGLSDALGVEDARVRGVVAFRLLDDGVDALDALIRTAEPTRLLTDAIDIDDALIASRDVARRLLETLGIDDAVARSAQLARTLVDSVDTLDALNAKTEILKILTDAIAVSDTAARNAYAIRAMIDAIDADDNLHISVSRINRLIDSIDVDDSTDVARNLRRILSESVSVEDTLTAEQTILIIRTLQDALEISDNSFRTSYAIRALIDAVVTTDNVEKSAQALRELRDAFVVDDAVSVARSLARLMVDDVTLADVLASQFALSLSDSITVADAFNAVRNADRKLIDTVILLDTISVSLDTITGIERTLIDDLAVDDAIDVAKSLFRNLIDSVDALDSAEFADEIFRILADSVVTEDDISASLLSAIFRQLVDGITVNDETVSTSYLVRLMQDAVDAEDDEALIYAVTRFLSDAVDAADDASFSTTLGGGIFFGLGVISTMTAEDIVSAIKRFD